MKAILKKTLLLIVSVLAVVVISLPCCAESGEQSGSEAAVTRFSFSAPKVIAAGSAIVAFVCSQIIILKHTDKE